MEQGLQLASKPKIMTENKTTHKVFIVDDHKLFRDGLKFVLSQTRNISVIGEAQNGIEFLKKIEHSIPDIVLMDISMPEMDGVEATQRAIRLYPEMKIIALSMFGDQEYYYKMIHAGIKGFVLKEASSRELEEAIETVATGDNYFSQELLRKIIVNLSDLESKQENKDIPLFNDRELEIMQLICSGYSNQEIAEKINLSVKTIEGYKTKLLNKTNSRNSVSLVMYAIKNKLIII
jgi:DNA-binding NarL/FixJ family response regulator